MNADVERWCRASLYVILALVSCSTLAQTYPARPIRFITGFPAGSSSDTLARLVSQRLTNDLKQPVIVDNRPGASGVIAAELTASAVPNGYTALFITAGDTLRPSLDRRVRYDVVRDFTAVSLVATAPSILVANTSVPVSSMAELVALAKSKPGELRYGTVGIGSTLHMGMELIRLGTGVEIVYVPYKGIPAALLDLMSGQIEVVYSTLAPALPFIKAGKIKPLAVTSAKRSPAVPDVPAVSETLPGFDTSSWWGVVVPAGTPGDIVALLNDRIVKIVRTPEIERHMSEMGFTPFVSSPQQFSAHIQAEVKKWRDAVKASGVRLQ